MDRYVELNLRGNLLVHIHVLAHKIDICPVYAYQCVGMCLCTWATDRTATSKMNIAFNH